MPEISDADLKKYQDMEKEYGTLKESVGKLETKNKELLDEKKKALSDKELADKAAKDAEEKRLKEQGDYKALAEKYETDKKEREEREKLQLEKLAKGAKLSKIQEELNKQGVDPKVVTQAMKLANIEDVKYDEATGVVTGADVVASKLKVEVPHLFVKKDQERMSNGDGGDAIPPEQMTVEWFEKLSAADQAKHHAAFMKAQGY